MIHGFRTGFALLALVLGPAAGAAPSAAAADPPPVAGDWEGILDAGVARLRVAFHVRQAPDGSLTAKMVSLDQGGVEIPATSATFSEGALRIEFANLPARYEGKRNESGSGFTGTWTQGPASLPLSLSRSAPPGEAPPSAPPPLRDTWLGGLQAGGSTLRVALHVSRGADGTLSAKFDSVDQGAMGIPVDVVSYEGGVLRFEIRASGISYEGKVDPTGTKLLGRFNQGTASLPLTFEAVDEAPALSRPQEPKRPFPYRDEEVAYENPEAKVTLAGTLTLPKGNGPFPAVVLITGSGPEDRDEAVFGHRPFLVLADHLTRNGIAVLRADDRGVGGSSAGPPDATSDDFAGDALAGVSYLKTRKEIDRKRIGLVGHSEGGMIAPIAATRSKDVAFLVLLAGTALPGEEILHLQSERILRASGAPAEQIAQARAVNETVYRIAREEKDLATAEKRVREIVEKVPGIDSKVVDAQVQAVLSPWFRHFLVYDPRVALAGVKVPILALNGELDVQVPAAENLSAMRQALEAARHRDHTLKLLPGLNHLFQQAASGLPAEYAQIEQTFSPEALTMVSDWILDRCGRKR